MDRTTEELEYRARDSATAVSAVFVRPGVNDWTLRVQSQGKEAGTLVISSKWGPTVLEALLPFNRRTLMNPPIPKDTTLTLPLS